MKLEAHLHSHEEIKQMKKNIQTGANMSHDVVNTYSTMQSTGNQVSPAHHHLLKQSVFVLWMASSL